VIENQPDLPLGTFWYAVAFVAGLYWGVSFSSGAFGSGAFGLLYPILVPPFVCFGMASYAAKGDQRRIILGAITLYINFLFSFGIGYVVAESGMVRFFYD